MSSNFIPVCEPCFLGNETRYAEEALRSGWISSAGEFISKFETEFSKFLGVSETITTTSGTTALHLALLALEIGPGDEVIVPDFTMAAVPMSVLHAGATPRFVDVEPETWNIDPSKIEEKISSKTKAIIVAHTYGHPAEMDKILEIANKHGLNLIEDCAEVHGGTFNEQMCGTFGVISCFSFFANKIITTGEGGAVCTSDPKLAERCRYFKNLCFSLKGPRDFRHQDLGYNYRMTNVQAAIGLGQLEVIDQLIERRRNIAAQYNRNLCDIPGLTLPAEKPNCKNVYWMYAVVVEPAAFGQTRDELMAYLKAQGIDTRLFFRPLHNQGFIESRGLDDHSPFPISEWLGEHGFYLPSGSGLTPEQVSTVSSKIIEAHSGRRG